MLPFSRLSVLGLTLVFAPFFALAENLSPLAKAPDWSTLEAYQETITRDEFLRLLQQLYAPQGVRESLLRVESETAQLRTGQGEEWFTLRFAPTPETAKPVPRRWKLPAALPPVSRFRELRGLHIAIDPGHIGGSWAPMEERWFQVGDSKPIQEGDMTLRVAKILAPKLRALGAKVTLVRSKAEPTTSRRPEDLEQASREILLRASDPPSREDPAASPTPAPDLALRQQKELLFYRNSEIRERARLVNEKIKPDLVLCLHFNAEAWDEPTNPTLIDRNHLHLLVNGSYLPAELDLDDVRFEMFRRLLSRAHEGEIPLAQTLAGTMARRTQLPPYVYTTDNVMRLGEYVYARNLLATRLYRAPVVYFEPYVMNSDEVFWRIQEGDYEGVRNVNGRYRPSIYREYVAGVVDGLIEYFREARN